MNFKNLSAMVVGFCVSSGVWAVPPAGGLGDYENATSFTTENLIKIRGWLAKSECKILDDSYVKAAIAMGDKIQKLVLTVSDEDDVCKEHYTESCNVLNFKVVFTDAEGRITQEKTVHCN